VTLVEFVAPLRKSTNRNKILAVLYYHHRYEGVDAMTVDQIRSALRSRARIPNAARMNIADVLAKSGAFIDTAGSENGKTLWRLTPTGEQEVRKLLGLPEAEPEIEHDVSSLEKIAADISDQEAKGFVEEAIKCLRVGALRASVVFLWSGAIRKLQQVAWDKGRKRVNAAIQKHDAKARRLSRVEDFAYMKDKTTLLALQDLGIVDKGQRGTLEEALNLRNRCGHPTKYRPGEKKVSSFIEDVTGIVF
jgi:hypothetical protein